MSYVSLYRRFRPNTFDMVVGQDHIIKTITNQIMSGKVSHAYLFTGTRGTGKTSCAKIFARAVNCLEPVNGSPCHKCRVCKELDKGDSIDIMEMDAASNNGVDEIRDLRENVQYRPTYGKYKVYIIDEVHMLTSSAFNAFLKTLEEPPEHAIFILATTEVQKLPQTILSRCMRFDFRLVSVDTLINHLKYIFDTLKVSYDIDALRQIAIQGEGSVRDALSLADMCLSYCKDHIGYKEVLDILGATNFETLDVLGRAILDGDVKTALETAHSLLKMGRTTIARDLANYFMDVIEVKNTPNIALDGISNERKEKLILAGSNHTNYRIARVMDIMASMENALRYSTQPRILLEANIVKACELQTELNLDGLTNRVKELEKKLEKMQNEGLKPIYVEAVQPVDLPTNSAKEIKLEQEEAVEEAKVDAQTMLEKMSIAKEEVTVFDDTKQEDDKSFLANEVWSKVLVRLDDMNENMLYDASHNIESVNISGKQFVASTKDKITFEIFRKPMYNQIIQKLIKEELDAEYSFVINKIDEEDKQAISQQDKVLLVDLFGGKIILD
ncbi:MAG: DNA polymerase III subunit gamma/tau [Clostridiales bacterium]|nr:DNA polymerase III subunit gamma/tau [Clostridiales bacterium]